MQLVFFRLHLVLHAYAAKFDVMVTTQNFLGTKQALNSVDVSWIVYRDRCAFMHDMMFKKETHRSTVIVFNNAQL